MTTKQPIRSAFLLLAIAALAFQLSDAHADETDLLPVFWTEDCWKIPV